MIPPRLIGTDVPVAPDAPDARNWLIDELSKPEYTAAKPTLLEQATQSFLDWIGSLFSGAGDASGLLVAVAAVLLVVALVIGVLIYGLPRLRHRSAARGSLFGEDDDRSADDLRRASDARAAAGDWSGAIEERFRAVARALVERTAVSLAPGTTSHAFARSAGDVFPAEQASIGSAADSFDAVRYLGRPGVREDFEAIRSLDERLAAASIDLAPVAGGAA
ncbi:DUF4129 domain-containing protein [Agromyces atrinae]|uniref:DUF4129 domain-containing protein n=1 Tax=Agromyces atrinae TaxID=592376 RepID=A0A4Q2MB40_9MICO|nr:DUF4129 domain-containing protein [Agromyces atrinae]NYD66645.1 hypothetical protein [Agromyces atrinae]RXZ87311.1 DUF4129 domain-containing protein [Agromyces atrinae]